ncbi:Potassium/proton antiporter RosB [Klebsiella pneumoniae subsp. ozaenae]|uniref:Potassium/proton antiporter RosB n=1 Tax=Klebsiella pneumoniae subsp. ozaenae TaxID=574 RepID=A0A377Z3W2_KLEPO|nr:Potassium/proton antiporter RosB [Klebsiella pneumoniae subsp. ozaenae]
MHHATPLITTIVGGLVLAFILGMIANKLRISPLVGYLLAGVLAGPFTPGFVADTTGSGTGGTWRHSADVRRRAAFLT